MHFDQMLAVADRLGHGKVNERPLGSGHERTATVEELFRHLGHRELAADALST